MVPLFSSSSTLALLINCIDQSIYASRNDQDTPYELPGEDMSRLRHVAREQAAWLAFPARSGIEDGQFDSRLAGRMWLVENFDEKNQREQVICFYLFYFIFYGCGYIEAIRNTDRRFLARMEASKLFFFLFSHSSPAEQHWSATKGSVTATKSTFVHTSNWDIFRSEPSIANGPGNFLPR